MKPFPNACGMPSMGGCWRVRMVIDKYLLGLLVIGKTTCMSIMKLQHVGDLCEEMRVNLSCACAMDIDL